MMLTDKFLLLTESFANDYMTHVEHFTNPANAGKIDDFMRAHFEQKIASAKEIYSFDGTDAHIRIEGPMSPNGPDLYDIFYGYGGVAYADILDGIEQAIADVNPKTGALYLHTNTPGGTVSMVDDVYQALATCGLRTIMLNKGIVASGGVWLSAACSEIVAMTPVAFTGSIGVVVSGYDISGMLEKIGVKRFVITNHEASEKVADVSTAEGRKVIQAELDAIYSIFKQRVVSGRRGKVTAETIDALKGSVKVATAALALGLIDRISDKSASSNTNSTRAKATAAPASKGAKAMNMQQLKAEHPDLVAAIVAEASQGMVSTTDLQAQIATARTEGAAAEQARIADVRAQALPGHEALIATLAADGVSTGADAAKAIVAAEAKLRLEGGNAATAEANPPAAAVAAENADGSKKVMKRSEWQKLPAAEQSAFAKAGGRIVD